MQKLNLTLVLMIVALAAALGLLGKVAWDKRELNHVNSALNEQLMQSRLEIGRAETKFGDAEKYAGELEKALEQEIKQRKAVVTRYGELRVKYDKLVNHEGTGNVVYIPGEPIEIPGKCPSFVRGLLYEAITDKTLSPIEELSSDYEDLSLTARCGFFPRPNTERKIPFRFQYRLHLNFQGEMVETITPSGAINNYFNLWEVDDKGKRIQKLELTSFSVVVDDQRGPKFYWWAPHLDVGLTLGFDTTGKFRTGGTIGISAMGYGLTENDLSWRFVRLGLDMAARPGLSLDPVQYNLGEHIPLISNLWISPHVIYMFNNGWTIGVMIGAVL